MRTVLFLLIIAAPAFAAEQKRPILIDTDIGADIDDAFALALAIASPEVDLVGVTTVGKGEKRDPYVRHLSKDRDEDRAWLVCRFLTQVGLRDIPVASGADPQPKSEIDWQIQYRRHPAAIYNRTLAPTKESAVELMTRLAKEKEGLTIVAIGPLTNVARFIKEQPEAAKRVKQFVIMGGSIAVGYDGKPKSEPEWNIKSDVPAAKTVIQSGLPITLIPLDATATVKLDKTQRERLFSARTPLTYQVQNLYELWDKETPVLFDPVAVAAAFSERFLTVGQATLSVNDDGMTSIFKGHPNARWAKKIDAEEFVKWYVERVRAFGKEVPPKPPENHTTMIEPGNFPSRIHAFEDFETDIEKRWWMCGKLETKDVPSPGKRVGRSVLTQDFDDRQGQLGSMYRAVIFNPVPGPPMGPNTRLKFKYKLIGTDTLRVQLYTLTNGYHRYLSLTGLEQGKWLDGCVDMTKMRRPDGTGGALAADERIDDIQFYVDPRAEVLIDEMVLYEAAAAGEKQPFPKRVLFTGLFDTGKQGVEWPGTFEIVPHKSPRSWKYAQSVEDAKSGEHHLVIGLRGLRKLSPVTRLSFKYQITGIKEEDVLIVLRSGKSAPSGRPWRPAKIGEWTDVTLKMNTELSAADEIRFILPKGTRLMVDDVLLYEGGDS